MKNWISIKETQKHLDFLKKLNETPLEEIVWIDENSKEVQIDPYWIKCWKFIGLNHKLFYETVVTSILAGKEDELRKEFYGIIVD